MRRIVLLLVATVVMVAMPVSSALSQPSLTLTPSCWALNNVYGQVRQIQNADVASEVVQQQRVEQGCEILT